MRSPPAQAEITPADQAEPVTWSSSDPDAAEVDRDTGLVTAGREPGRTKITARSQGGLTDSCEGCRAGASFCRRNLLCGK